MVSDLTERRARVAAAVQVDVLSATHVVDNEEKFREVSRSFISDTVTVPTPEMVKYATLASLGDDVYHEPSTHALEAHVAKITGKEAGIFVPTGTMSNQLALRSHLLQPPYSVLVDHRGHVYKYEAGGAAFHSGAHLIAVAPSNGHHLTLADVQQHMITDPDVHFACTEVVALENTLNGTIIPQEEVVAISDWVHSQGAKMHLDGARIWHVAAELGIPLDELCAPFDSVSLCLSKGLGAPVGTILVGSQKQIQKARHLRKLFGGGMRQIGFLAGAAAYALTHNFPHLPAVHALAKKLEAGLEELGVDIMSRAETCMVFFDPTSIGIQHEELAQRAAELPNPLILGGSRLVVHIQTSSEAVDDLLALIKQLADEKIAAGFVKSDQPAQKNGSIYVRVRN